MSYGYIYKTTNLRNGHVYIGQKHGSFNPSYLGSGTILKKAIKKYGKAAFSLIVLCECENQESLNCLEKFHIHEQRTLLSHASVYNISLGGDAFMTGIKHSEESKKRMSEARRGPKNWLYGKGHLISGRNNPNFGKKQSENARRKIGEANAKHFGPDHGLYGKKKSLEHSIKNRIVHKGLITSQSRCDLISEILKAKGLFYKELPTQIRNIAATYRMGSFQKQNTLEKNVARFCEYASAFEYADRLVSEFKRDEKYFTDIPKGCRTSGMLGKKHSEETRKRIGSSQIGRKRSEETKNKMRQSRRLFLSSKVGAP